MRPVYFIADLHVHNFGRYGGEVKAGINDRARRTLEVLGWAVNRAVVAKASALVALGDIFDTDHPEPQLVRAVQDWCWVAQDSGVRVILEKGNHDTTSDAIGDHALGPLTPYATIVERPELIQLPGANLVAVPFQRGPAAKYIPDAVRALTDKQPHDADAPTIVALHAGIFDADTPEWLRGESAISVDTLRKIAKTHGAAAIVSGDYHKRKQWGNIVQCGALAATSHSNPGKTGYGSVWRFDGTLSVEELPGPRFLTLQGVEEAADPSNHSPNYYLRVQCTRAEVPQVRDILEKIPLGGFEIEVHKADTAAETRGAAVAARSATTLEEAVNRYVTGMDLGDNHTEVLNKVRSYLRLS